jgi:putative toxin-antitoxin system antitoxin component (TIGR02293 family)
LKVKGSREDRKAVKGRRVHKAQVSIGGKHYTAVLNEKVVQLLGGTRVLRHQVISELDAHEMLHRGLPAKSLTSLLGGLIIMGTFKASRSALEEALGISWRTVQRRKAAPKKLLSQEQSGRTWKFAEVLAKATEVLGSQRDAEQWMERPAIGLDQRRPIDLLTTPAGAELVETFLERLEYGVYS